MNEKWYYFAVGVIVSAAIFSLLGIAVPDQNIFTSQPRTGLIVKEVVKEDLNTAKDLNITLIDYYQPFDGRENLPGGIVYNGTRYSPMLANYTDFKHYAGVLGITYLFSIGDSKEGKYPLYFVKIGEKPFLKGIVILDTPFPEDKIPFT